MFIKDLYNYFIMPYKKVECPYCGKNFGLPANVAYYLYRKDKCEWTKCPITNKEHQKLYKRRLIVHHLDGNRSNNNEMNLLTLCTSHHTRMRGILLSHIKTRPDFFMEMVKIYKERFEIEKENLKTLIEMKEKEISSLKKDKIKMDLDKCIKFLENLH